MTPVRMSRVVAALAAACAALSGARATPLAAQVPRGVQPGGDEFVGTRRAVVIGVSRYRNLPPDRQLGYAADDAELFARLLRSRAGGALPEANVRVLLDSAATNGAIWDALRWLRSQSKSKDVAIVYFAGHGDVEEATGAEGGFLLAHDAPVGRNYPAGGAVDLAQVQRMAQFMSAAGVRVVLVTDACRAGKLVGSPEGARNTTAALVEHWTNTVKLISTAPDGLSYEDPRWGDGHGVFTWFLVRGLLGDARASRDGLVRPFDLTPYLLEQVRGATDDRQIPQVVGGASVALAMRDTGSRTLVLASARPGVPASPALAGTLPPFGIRPSDWRALPAGTVALVARIDTAVRANRVAAVDAGGAWALFQSLDASPAGARVRPRVASAVAAALQDGAQRIVSEYLAGRTPPTPVAARQAADALGRAEALLGTGDPTARSLRARRLFLEGYALYVLGRSGPAAERLRASLALEDAAYALNGYGAALRAAGQPDSAERVLQRVVALAPRWAFPLNTLGVVAIGRRRFDEAARYLARALAIDSTYGKAYYNLGRALDGAGRRAAADSARQTGMRVDPETVASLLSDEWLRTGDTARAEGVLREAIVARPRGAVTMVRLADLYKARGRLDDAERQYREAVAADSTAWIAWSGLGTLHHERFAATRDSARLDSAVANYRRAARIAPAEPVPYQNLAMALGDAGREAGVDSALAAAVALDSTDAETFGLLGMARARQRRDAEAEAAYRRAIALDSLTAEYPQGLGALYRRMGRAGDAERAYLAALRTMPRSAALLTDLGDLYAEQRMTTKAVEAYRRASAVDDGFERARMRLQQLAPDTVTRPPAP